MAKEKKAFSKKEKIVGAIASTAILAVPFMVAPAQQGYATSSVPPTATPVDKIQTIVLPVNGSKSIDLGVVYNGFYEGFSIEYNTSSDSNVAKFNDNLTSHGLLKIDAVSKGKATFTVTTFDDEKYVKDTIDVIVVSSEGFTGLDIKKSVEAIISFPNDYNTNDIVKDLISQINPAIVPVNDPYSVVGNNPPIRNSNNTAIETSVGSYISIYELSNYNYFSDSDSGQHLYYLLPDYHNEYIDIYDSEGTYLIPKKAGTINFPVIVLDGYGGIIESTIPIIIHETEFINLDYETSITLDLQSYFPGLNATSFYYDDPDEVGGADISDSSITFNSEDPGDYKIVALNQSHQPIGNKYFRVTDKDYLRDRNLLEGTRLEMDLSQFFSTETTVSSSVYYQFIQDESSTVTDVTYGLVGPHTLYFDAYDSLSNEGNVSGKIIAKDSTNHQTYVEKINVNLEIKDIFPIGEDLAIGVNNLFDPNLMYPYEEELWEDVVLSYDGMTFSLEEYESAMVIKTSGVGTSLVTLNYNQNKIKYMIPFNNQ
ncbi:MAG: hypothetical protein K0Q73_1509 [Paenibacillus sp.]|nr:hypothetical protein [Paenibacillus sp.]